MLLLFDIGGGGSCDGSSGVLIVFVFIVVVDVDIVLMMIVVFVVFYRVVVDLHMYST